MHEGDNQLEYDISNIIHKKGYLRFINAYNPYYDPILRLDDEKTISLLLSSSLNEHKIPDKGILYLRGMLKLLRKTSITPYIHKLITCPHERIHQVILSAEQSGIISSSEADEIRNNIDEGQEARSSIEYLFSELKNERYLRKKAGDDPGIHHRWCADSGHCHRSSAEHRSSEEDKRDRWLRSIAAGL